MANAAHASPKEIAARNGWTISYDKETEDRKNKYESIVRKLIE